MLIEHGARDARARGAKHLLTICHGGCYGGCYGFCHRFAMAGAMVYVIAVPAFLSPSFSRNGFLQALLLNLAAGWVVL